MAANLRRLASTSTSTLSRQPQPPGPPPALLLRLALSNSAPFATDPPAPARKVEGEEAAGDKGATDADEGKAAAAAEERHAREQGHRRDRRPARPKPTRYGDWERGG
ncbi:hypothetical protein SETIT_5G026500v2 [Setaria italica]|uniref:Succinate dehydrogenase assembly factor 4, mitochondrial n=1 Tax=Setaria italica TaxID=4555 RepID=K3XR90_SETIT|nr:hypothetical protein SETIT_5G026500v2 [Setaria italica]